MRVHHAERNAAIIAAYKAGETQVSIAARYGINHSRISYILRNAGARLPADELRQRRADHARKMMNDPEMRAKIRAKITARWADGAQMGRPKLFADDPARREDYLMLRDVYGAAKAREIMGVAA